MSDCASDSRPGPSTSTTTPIKKCFICPNPQAPPNISRSRSADYEPLSVLQILGQTLQLKGNPLIGMPDPNNPISCSNPTFQYPFCRECLEIVMEVIRGREELVSLEHGIYERINWIQEAVVNSLGDEEKGDILKWGLGPEDDDVDVDNTSLQLPQLNQLNFRRQIYSKFKARQLLEEKIKQSADLPITTVQVQPSVSQLNLISRVKLSRSGNQEQDEKNGSDEANGNEDQDYDTEIKIRQDLIVKMEIEPDCTAFDLNNQNDVEENEGIKGEEITSDSDTEPSHSRRKLRRSCKSYRQNNKILKLFGTQPVITDENGRMSYADIEIVKAPGETPESEYSVSCAACGKAYDQASCKARKSSALSMIQRHIREVHYGDPGSQMPSKAEKRERLREAERQRKRKWRSSAQNREREMQRRRELRGLTSTAHREKKLQQRREHRARASNREKELRRRRELYASKKTKIGLCKVIEDHSSSLTITPQGEISYKNIPIQKIDLNKRDFNLKCGACGKILNKELMKENNKSPYKEIISHIQQAHFANEVFRAYKPRPKSVQAREDAARASFVEHMKTEFPAHVDSEPDVPGFPELEDLLDSKPSFLELEPLDSDPEFPGSPDEPMVSESEPESTGPQKSQPNTKQRLCVPPLRTQHDFITNELGEMSYGSIQIHKIDLEQGNFQLKCGECERTIFRGDSLKRKYCVYRSMAYHIQGHHLEGFQCDVCDKKYQNFKYWGVHCRTHSEEEVENKRKTSNLALAEEETQNGTGIFKCSECSQRFLNMYDLQKHERIHRGFVPSSKHVKKYTYVCDECGNTYARKRALTRHKIRVHSLQLKPKYYSCPICSKKFRNQELLNEHGKFHADMTEDGDYLCSDCGKKLKSKAGLDRHKKFSCKFEPTVQEEPEQSSSNANTEATNNPSFPPE